MAASTKQARQLTELCRRPARNQGQERCGQYGRSHMNSAAPVTATASPSMLAPLPLAARSARSSPRKLEQCFVAPSGRAQVSGVHQLGRVDGPDRSVAAYETQLSKSGVRVITLNRRAYYVRLWREAAARLEEAGQGATGCLLQAAPQHARVLGQCRCELLDDSVWAHTGHGAPLCPCTSHSLWLTAPPQNPEVLSCERARGLKLVF
jgi:hypothetical protein